MRVKLLLALAIASVLLLCSAGAASASGDLSDISNIATAEELTAAAESEISAFGFPDLNSISGLSASDVAIGDSFGLGGLDSSVCGVCGECPPCSCEETLTTIPGPAVNLGCPVVGIQSKPVNLVSPVIRPVFKPIDVRPQAIVTLPQVNAKLNCFDIECLPVTSINECPVIEKPRPVSR